MSKIVVGSKCFFDGIEDFTPHDDDYLELVDNPEDFKYKKIYHGKFCLFKWKRMSADEYIDYMLNISTLPMEVGKFLVPEFVKEIGFTIEDLKKLEPIINNIDEKHNYEKIIFNSYIENNDFVLTEEQKLKAYNEYKKYR